MDLVTQKQLTKEQGQTLVSSIDHGHGPNEKAIILVDEQWTLSWRLAQLRRGIGAADYYLL